MLAELRRHSKSVIIYVLFGIIIVVFVFTFNMSGGSNQNVAGHSNGSNAELVTVGDASIDMVDFEMGLRLTIDPPSPDREMTADTYRQAQIFRTTRFQEFPGSPVASIFGRDPWSVTMIKSKKVKEDMIETWLVSEEARKNGLVASPDEVRDRILERFTDPSTKEFRRGYYENWVRYQIRSTMARFEDFVAREIEREKMIGFVTSAVLVPEREARLVATLRKNVRNYEFLEISPALLNAALVPGTREVASWLKSNQDKAKAFFDSHVDEFGQDAGFDFNVLKYADKARADAVASELAAKTGEELRKVMTDLASDSEDNVTNKIGGRSGAALAADAVASLYGQEVADALAAIQETTLSPVIKGKNGFYLVMLNNRSPAIEPDFERSAEVIARRLLGEEKGAAEIDGLAARALEMVNAAGDRPLAEVAAELNSSYAPHNPVRIGETGEIRKMPVSIEGMLSYDPEAVPGIGKGADIAASLAGLTDESRVLGTVLQPAAGGSRFVVRLKSGATSEEPTSAEIENVSSELSLFKRLAVWRDWYGNLRARSATAGDLVEKDLLAKMIADEERALEEAVSGKNPASPDNSDKDQTVN